MLTQRQLFLNHIAQTSDAPLLLEIERAEGVYLIDVNGRKYIDLISGISVSNLGHRHPRVLDAIHRQLDKYMHLMVYGEFVLSPQVELAKLLVKHLPEPLSTCYFVNSGAEAVEGALKLAKRYTGRSEIISFKNSYHGSTHGALSILGNESFKTAYRPLLPGVRHINFNNFKELDKITEATACVVAETVQAELGVLKPEPGFLQALRQRCTETGTLLILDEIQVGFGRTGSLFGFEQYNIVPDVLLLAKGMGGGMPLGAFISSPEIMGVLKENPVLGHITTFGGHPVSCAASLATLQVILDERLVDKVKEKERLFLEKLQHKFIKSMRSAGLLMALEFEDFTLNKKIIDLCIEEGVLTDWFLFASNCLRIAPPLTITADEIEEACSAILRAIDRATK